MRPARLLVEHQFGRPYRLRKHRPSVKPGSGHDLFCKLGRDQYRLSIPENDPEPLCKPDIEKLPADLKLACARIPDVRLIEYEISFKLQAVSS